MKPLKFTECVNQPDTKPERLVYGTGSAALSRCAAAPLASPMKRPPTIAVILSAAKDLATDWIATVALGADFLSASQMLHFVQHDKCRKGDWSV